MYLKKNGQIYEKIAQKILMEAKVRVSGKTATSWSREGKKSATSPPGAVGTDKHVPTSTSAPSPPYNVKDPYMFFTDPDPGFYFNTDPDQGPDLCEKRYLFKGFKTIWEKIFCSLKK